MQYFPVKVLKYLFHFVKDCIALQALKALVYFEDAEKEPMPRMPGKASWREIKNFFEREVPAIAKKRISRHP